MSREFRPWRRCTPAHHHGRSVGERCCRVVIGPIHSGAGRRGPAAPRCSRGMKGDVPFFLDARNRQDDAEPVPGPLRPGHYPPPSREGDPAPPRSGHPCASAQAPSGTAWLDSGEGGALTEVRDAISATQSIPDAGSAGRGPGASRGARSESGASLPVAVFRSRTSSRPDPAARVILRPPSAPPQHGARPQTPPDPVRTRMSPPVRTRGSIIPRLLPCPHFARTASRAAPQPGAACRR
jgi:hypothetical protein